MSELNQGTVENDVRLKRTQYFGPGQTAQATMDLLVKSGAGDGRRRRPEVG
jgi:hypothetical protein